MIPYESDQHYTGDVDTSNWKKMDSRKLGISLPMIPYASRTLLKILQNAGFLLSVLILYLLHLMILNELNSAK